jgi:hypothetical protein
MALDLSQYKSGIPSSFDHQLVHVVGDLSTTDMLVDDLFGVSLSTAAVATTNSSSGNSATTTTIGNTTGTGSNATNGGTSTGNSTTAINGTQRHYNLRDLQASSNGSLLKLKRVVAM